MRRIDTKYKIATAFILAIILSSTVTYAATVLGASSVSYNNSSSKLSSTTVQGAIDEIYNNATGEDIVYNNKNILGAYMYDATSCKTGDENTCKKTDCPNNTSSQSCPSGTIIKYKVNSSTIRKFNVLYGNASTLTLQDSADTVSSVAWYSSEDNTKGPLTVLQALESETAGWSNVNTMEYTMGTTVFTINAYTGCNLTDKDWNCDKNKYTLGVKSVKARMITAQETASVGCRYYDYSCPDWMRTGGGWYWTMSADSSNSNKVLYVSATHGSLSYGNVTSTNGARAVVVINK